jgi:hypothetical protein
VAALLAGLGKTSPEAVAALLERLLADTAAIAKHERAAARFELLRIAAQLGPPAYGVVVGVVRQHSDVRPVRSLDGEPWERHYAAIKALDVLRSSTAQPVDDSFRRLRTRLIDLGHHEATTINPPNTTE